MNEEREPAAGAAVGASAETNESARRGALEFFTQKARLADARRRVFAKGDPGFAEFELGLVALRDGAELATARDAAALPLVRVAVRLLVRATLTRARRVTSDTPWTELWERAQEVAVVATFRSSDASTVSSELVDAVLKDDGDFRIASLSPAEHRAVLGRLTRLSQRLAALLADDAWGVRRVVWSRRWRAALTLFLVALALAAPVRLVLRRPNIALHRPVVLNDRDDRFPIDPAQVVDGDRYNLGFHSSDKVGSMVTIDLGSTRPIHRVDVYNRGDCCQERAVPLALALSSDGREFRLIAGITTVFEVWSPAIPNGTSARFVRLVHGSTTFFHLSEIEVY